MNVLFEKEVAELRQKGISLNDLTPDEVVALVHSVDRMMKPFREANLEAAGMPVVMSDGTTLYNLTIGATVWLDEYAGEWWDTNSKAYFWAMVYALAHGRDREAFTGKMLFRDTARSQIVEMACRIHLTEDELLEGIERAVHKCDRGTEKHPQGIGQETDWGEILRTLEATTGIPTDQWVWGKSADWCVKVYHNQRKFMEAMKGKSVARMKDELDYATNALARVRCGILKRLGKEG